MSVSRIPPLCGHSGEAAREPTRWPLRHPFPQRRLGDRQAGSCLPPGPGHPQGTDLILHNCPGGHPWDSEAPALRSPWALSFHRLRSPGCGMCTEMRSCLGPPGACWVGQSQPPPSPLPAKLPGAEARRAGPQPDGPGSGCPSWYPVSSLLHRPVSSEPFSTSPHLASQLPTAQPPSSFHPPSPQDQACRRSPGIPQAEAQGAPLPCQVSFLLHPGL